MELARLYASLVTLIHGGGSNRQDCALRKNTVKLAFPIPFPTRRRNKLPLLQSQDALVHITGNSLCAKQHDT